MELDWVPEIASLLEAECLTSVPEALADESKSRILAFFVHDQLPLPDPATLHDPRDMKKAAGDLGWINHRSLCPSLGLLSTRTAGLCPSLFYMTMSLGHARLI